MCLLLTCVRPVHILAKLFIDHCRCCKDACCAPNSPAVVWCHTVASGCYVLQVHMILSKVSTNNDKTRSDSDSNSSSSI